MDLKKMNIAKVAIGIVIFGMALVFLGLEGISWFVKVPVIVIAGAIVAFKLWLGDTPFYLKTRGKNFGEWLRSWGSFSGWFGFHAALLAIIWGVHGWDKVEYFVASRSFAPFYWTMHFVYVVILGGPLGGRGGSGALQFVRGLTYGIVFYPLLALTLVQMLLIGIGTKPIPLFFSERGKGGYTQTYHQSAPSNQRVTSQTTRTNVPQPQPTHQAVTPPVVRVDSTKHVTITPATLSADGGYDMMKVCDLPAGTKKILVTELTGVVVIGGQAKNPQDGVLYFVVGDNAATRKSWILKGPSQIPVTNAPAPLYAIIPAGQTGGSGSFQFALSYN